jgi:hypothetical protein
MASFDVSISVIYDLQNYADHKFVPFFLREAWSHVYYGDYVLV